MDYQCVSFEWKAKPGETGIENYRSCKTAPVAYWAFVYKNIKKEEKLMKVKSVIINSQYIFHIPSASNYYAHQS